DRQGSDRRWCRDDARRQPRRLPQLHPRIPRARRGPLATGSACGDRDVARSDRGAGIGMSQPEAEIQLERVLAMVPWLATHPGVHKDEIAARFRVSRAQLEKDLTLIMMVGVPPYSPGDYI